MMSQIGHTFVRNDPTKAVSFNTMKKRVMVCTHCTGGELGPVQRPNGKYSVVPYRNAHTRLRQGQASGPIVTVRKSSCRKVMFSQACVKNSVHRGVCLSAC